MKYNLYTSDSRISDKAVLVKSFDDFLEVKMAFQSIVKEFKQREHDGQVMIDKSHRYAFQFSNGEIIDLFFIQSE